MLKTKYICLLFFLFLFNTADASKYPIEFKVKENTYSQFNLNQLVLPIGLIGYGFWALNNPKLKSYDYELQRKLRYQQDRVLVNDLILYTPVFSVYALNALGIHGKHNFVDRSIALLTAHFITINSVIQLKSVTKVHRPDGTGRSSFPSGHTAIAFMCAEFLHQEFKHTSPLYSFTGYLVASGIAYHRIYINRHWFSDVVAGAGFGILGTKVAYWLLPIFQKALVGVKKSIGISQVAPYYKNGKTGIGIKIDL